MTLKRQKFRKKISLFFQKNFLENILTYFQKFSAKIFVSGLMRPDAHIYLELAMIEAVKIIK